MDWISYELTIFFIVDWFDLPNIFVWDLPTFAFVIIKLKKKKNNKLRLGLFLDSSFSINLAWNWVAEEYSWWICSLGFICIFHKKNWVQFFHKKIISLECFKNIINGLTILDIQGVTDRLGQSTSVSRIHGNKLKFLLGHEVGRLLNLSSWKNATYFTCFILQGYE